MNDKDKIWTTESLAKHTGKGWSFIKETIKAGNIPPYQMLGKVALYDHRALAVVNAEIKRRASPEFRDELKKTRLGTLKEARQKQAQLRAIAKTTPTKEPVPQAKETTQMDRIEAKLDALLRELCVKV